MINHLSVTKVNTNQCPGESCDRNLMVSIPDPIFSRPNIKEKKQSGYARLTKELSERAADPTDWEQGRAIKKVADIVYTDRLEEEIKASPFQCIDYLSPPM